MTDQEQRQQIGRAELQDLSHCAIKVLLDLRKRHPDIITIWKSDKPAAALVQIKLCKGWEEKLVPQSERGLRFPWGLEPSDKTVIHAFERVLCKDGQSGETIRIDVGGPQLVRAAWEQGFLKRVIR